MRRLLSALLGGTLLLAAAPWAPVAAAAPAPTEFLRAVVADLESTPAGQSPYLQVSLRSGTQPVPGASITLLVRRHGAPEFTPGATVTTDADGTAGARVPLTRSATFVWTFAGTAEHAASKSEAFVERIASRVRIKASDRTLVRGQKLVVTGTTFPAKPGQRVRLMQGQVRYPLSTTPPPKQLSRGVVGSDGRLRLTASFTGTGSRQLFVVVAPGDGNAQGTSNYLRVRVR